jgi:hypothetical protein
MAERQCIRHSTTVTHRNAANRVPVGAFPDRLSGRDQTFDTPVEAADRIRGLGFLELNR